MNVLDIKRDTTCLSGLSRDRFSFEFVLINTATETIIGYFSDVNDGYKYMGKHFLDAQHKFLEVVENPYYQMK